MKRVVISLLAVALLWACSLREQTDIEINPKPTLRVDYRYLDKNGTNTFLDQIVWVDAFLFDPSNRFIRSQRIERQTLFDSAGRTLLSGVPEGDYTIVSFANTEGGDFSTLTPGVSRLSELTIRTTGKQTHPGSEKRFHSLNRYHVSRGWPQVRAIDLEKLYYLIDLTVTGLDSKEGAVVEMQGVPAGFDATGARLSEHTAVSVPLERRGEHLGSLFAIGRFGRQNQVGIRLEAQGVTLCDVSLSEYLNKAQVGIDFENGRDIVIPIRLDVSVGEVTLVINGWEVETVQYPTLGD